MIRQENWIIGMPASDDLFEPVMIALKVLSGWSDTEVKAVWKELSLGFSEWAASHGEKPMVNVRGALQPKWERKLDAEPWECAGREIRDFGRLLISKAIADHQPRISRVMKDHSMSKALAVIILAEAHQAPPDHDRPIRRVVERRRQIVRCWRELYYLQESLAIDRDKEHEKDIDDWLTRAEKIHREVISEQATEAARSRHQKSNLVRERAIELFLVQREDMPDTSKAEAVRQILPEIMRYSGDVGFRYSKDNFERTVYGWILRATKKN